jgi:hypothetical protein
MFRRVTPKHFLHCRDVTAVPTSSALQNPEGFLLSAHSQQPAWRLRDEPVTNIATRPTFRICRFLEQGATKVTYVNIEVD